MTTARFVSTLAVLLCAAIPANAQQRPDLRIVGPDDAPRTVPVAFHRGYAAVPASALRGFGWSVSAVPGGWRVEHPGGPRLVLREGSPFFEWDGALLQLVSEPYALGGELHVPVQLLLDFFPARLPEAYARGGPGAAPAFRVTDPAHWVADAGGPDEGAAAAPPAARPPDPAPAPAARGGGARVVVIDPGHGGRDPGSIGPTGLREKDVALAVSLALARELENVPGLEVHLTRDSDVLIPIWRRGELATELKGDRPGVFVSIHTNAVPQRAARGFETYFLSDARTEHERRVAALENAPLALVEEQAEADSDLGFILQELRKFDHAHWSSLLAEMVQARVSDIHPGPNRGVKQGPLAVITNALMPAVLVETGFISNREEERVLAGSAFHDEVARALADAVLNFFERYPPGETSGLEGRLPERR